MVVPSSDKAKGEVSLEIESKIQSLILDLLLLHFYIESIRIKSLRSKVNYFHSDLLRLCTARIASRHMRQSMDREWAVSH